MISISMQVADGSSTSVVNSVRAASAEPRRDATKILLKIPSCWRETCSLSLNSALEQLWS